MARPFDAKRLELSGDAFPLAEQIQYDAPYSHAVFSSSANGVLVYQAGSTARRTQLVWTDRDGTETATVADQAIHFAPRLSPDGQFAAVVIDDLQSAQADIWIIDLSRGIRTRFTFDPGNDVSPIWSPDGSYLIFTSDRNGPMDLYRKSVGGLGDEELMLESDQDKYPTGWSPDGSHVVYDARPAMHGRGSQPSSDLGVLALGDAQAPAFFLRTSFGESNGAFSPDGRWLAYQSDESGRDEVYVTPFPGPGRKWQVSTDGGIQPVWRKDGRELFYIAPYSRLMAANVQPGETTFETGEVRSLFALTRSAGGRPYDAASDGERFLVSKDVVSNASPPLTLVINWTAELKKK